MCVFSLPVVVVVQTNKSCCEYPKYMNKGGGPVGCNYSKNYTAREITLTNSNRIYMLHILCKFSIWLFLVNMVLY